MQKTKTKNYKGQQNTKLNIHIRQNHSNKTVTFTQIFIFIISFNQHFKLQKQSRFLSLTHKLGRDNSDFSLLGSVGEVVVPRTEVSPDTGFGHLPQPHVKVGTSIVKLVHISPVLGW